MCKGFYLEIDFEQNKNLNKIHNYNFNINNKKEIGKFNDNLFSVYNLLIVKMYKIIILIKTNI